MKKQKNHKELEGEKLRGKRRFIERVVEEKEAEQQIKEFDRNELVDGREDDLVSRPDRR